METTLAHHLAQLHAGSAEDAKKAMHIEECLEAQREELQDELLNRINDAPIDKIFFGIQQDNMQEAIEALHSNIYDLPEIERPSLLAIHAKLVAVQLYLVTTQAIADKALKTLNEELS